jgi:hypothetical protein
MKKVSGLIAAWLLLPAAFVSAQGTFGTVNFNNRVLMDGVDAPIYDLSVPGTPLEGSAYLAQLYSGPVGTTEDKLVPTGAIVDFRTGLAAGYLNVGTDGSRTIPNVLPGDYAVLQIRAWSASAGATYEQALASTDPAAKIGKSNLVTVQTKASALDVPVNMIGLQSFAVTPVPEPAVLAMGATGLFLLTFRLRTRR